MSALLDLLKEFDIAKILPEMDTFVGQLAGWLRLILLICPVVLLVLGAWLRYAPPDEANYSLGFRTKWSMSSVAVWRYSQKLASKYFLLVGGVLAVVVLVISLFFGPLGPMGMAITALLCVIAEAAVIIWLHVYIDKKIRMRYDQNGNLRK